MERITIGADFEKAKTPAYWIPRRGSWAIPDGRGLTLKTRAADLLRIALLFIWRIQPSFCHQNS